MHAKWGLRTTLTLLLAAVVCCYGQSAIAWHGSGGHGSSGGHSSGGGAHFSAGAAYHGSSGSVSHAYAYHGPSVAHSPGSFAGAHVNYGASAQRFNSATVANAYGRSNYNFNRNYAGYAHGYGGWAGYGRYGRYYPGWGYGLGGLYGWSGYYDPGYGWGGYGGYGYPGYADYGYGLYGAPLAYEAYYGSGTNLPPVDSYPDTTTAGDYAAPGEPGTVAGAPGDENGGGADYLNGAREAFVRGDYAQAARLASHAAVELPRDARVHELMSLALFALQDYRGSNREAHAALSLGPAADWNTLYGYYRDVTVYTRHLDALAAYIAAHRNAADARFVMAYQDMMMGHNQEARDGLMQVLKLVPQDKLAAQLVEKLGGTPPKNNTPPAPPKPGVVSVLPGPREI
jgi:hypothetical protein